MLALLVWAGLVGGVLVATAYGGPPGTLPRDVLPTGWQGPPESVSRVQGSSGQIYELSRWPPNSSAMIYFIAQALGRSNSWIGYLENAAGERRQYRGSASTAAEFLKLQRDFRVVT